MARDLAITITVDNADAKTKLAAVDSALRSTTTQTKSFHAANTEAVDGMDKFVGMADRIIERLAIYASARAMVGAIRSTLEFGAQIDALSKQTGLSTDMIQKLNLVSADYGIQAGEMANAVSMLSQRLAGGDESAAGAVRALGLSIESLIAEGPDKAFVDIAKAVGQIENPMLKAAIAKDLFGRAAIGMLPVFNREIEDTLDHTKTLINTMDPDVVKATAAAENAWSRLGITLKVIVGQSITGWGQIKDAVTGAAGTVYDKLQALWRGNEMLTDSATKSGDAWFAQSEKLRQTASAVQVVLTQEQIAKNTIDGLRTEALKPLTDTQVLYLQQLFDMGQLTASNAQKLGVTAVQMDLFKKKEDELIQTQTNLSTQLREMASLSVELGNKYGETLDKLNEKTLKLLENQTRLRGEAMIQGAAAIDSLNQRGQAPLSPFDQALRTREQGYKDIANQEAQTPGVSVQGVDVYSAMRAKLEAEFDDAITHLNDGAVSAGTALTGIAPSVDAAAAAFGRFTGVTMAPFYTANGSVGVPGSNVGTPRGNNIGTPVVGGVGYGYAYSSMAGIFARAAGGPVSSGSPYWVGERGPELFVPGSSGGIVPNGGVSIGDIHIHGDVDSSSRGRQMADAIATEVMRRIKQTNGKRPYAGS